MISGKFVTVKEAASELGIDASLVTRYCRTGRLDAQQVSRAWLIRRKALSNFARQPRERGNPNFKARFHARNARNTRK